MILYYDNNVYINKLHKLFIRELAIISLRDIVILIVSYNVIIISI